MKSQSRSKSSHRKKNNEEIENETDDSEVKGNCQGEESTVAIGPLHVTFTRLHLIFVFVMFMIYIFGSYLLPTIDIKTLKPGPGFPQWLKAASYYSNIPIKLGVVHAAMFSLELYRSPKLFSRHVGQRLSTLWVQFFQHPRWGQHLHMQTETLLQVIDIHHLKRCSNVEEDMLKCVGFLMMFTNFVTSSAYHTFEEQTIGFVFALVKLCVDYSHFGAHLNSYIGSTLSTINTLGSGLVFFAFFFTLFNYVLAIEMAAELLVHPTVMATTLFTGGFLGQKLKLFR